MKKVDKVISEWLGLPINEAAPPPSPDEAPPGGPEQAPGTGVEPKPIGQEKQAVLAPQGKVMLVDMALKALSIDPNDISQPEKAVFNQDVSPENAEEIASQVRSIIQTYGYNSEM